MDTETADALRTADERVIETGRMITTEERLRGTPLGDRDVLTRKVPLRDDQGKIVGVLGASIDITRRKAVERQLSESLIDLELAQHMAKLGSWHYDPQVGEPVWSEMIYEIFERDPALGPTTMEEFYQFFQGEVQELFIELEREALLNGTPFDRILPISLPGGQKKWIRTICRPDPQPGPAGYAVRGITQDVTTIKRAEETLRHNRANLLALIENTDGSIWSVDRELRLIVGNSAFHRNITQGRGRPFAPGEMIFAPEFSEGVQNDWRDYYRRALAGERFSVELSRQVIDTNSYVEYRFSPIQSSDGAIAGVTVFGRDITDRKKAEEQLRLLNEAMEQSPASVVITDTHGTIQYVNPRFCQLTGYSLDEVIGQNPRILKSGEQPPEFYNKMWATITTGQQWRGEMHNKKKNGDLFWELASIVGVKNPAGEITHFLGVKEDITERKQREAETVRQERLAAVGQLAAGIAHDFNNMLMAIIGNANLLEQLPDTPEKIKDRLAGIVTQGEQAAQLTRQILDFSRQSMIEPRPLDLRVFLKETIRFIGRTLPENIKITYNFDHGNYTIHADPAQIQQIVTNLAVNARDAMPQGGRLDISLGRLTLPEGATLPASEMSPGEWIILTVSDTGEGIPPEALPHIFEPFFTTKALGSGTGLGLAQVYGIVHQHNGDITVKSRLGQGVTFTIYFPVLVTEASSAPPQPSPDIPLGQGQTVLVVEDEAVVLEVTRAMLETLNYKVLTATSGLAALEVLSIHLDQIDLVLSDVVMVDMGGIELAEQLATIAPGMPMLLMTGYAPSPAPTTTMGPNIKGRLHKPLGVRALARAARKALRDY
jgi:PAS domain S-box-containing protein